MTPRQAPLTPLTLVTGANRGLGLHLSRALARQGHRLILVCRDGTRMPDLCEPSREDGEHALVSCDLTRPVGLERQLIAALTGMQLTFVINNASIFSEKEEGGLGDLSAQEIADMVMVNSAAPAIVMHAVEKLLAPGAVVINVLSDMAFPADWDGSYPLYRATKAFLWSLTVNAQVLFARRGAKVIGVDPGWMRTDMGGPNAPNDPVAAASGILGLLRDQQTLQSGAVYDPYRGCVA